MKNKKKTKKQLLDELQLLQMRVQQLESLQSAKDNTPRMPSEERFRDLDKLLQQPFFESDAAGTPAGVRVACTVAAAAAVRTRRFARSGSPRTLDAKRIRAAREREGGAGSVFGRVTGRRSVVRHEMGRGEGAAFREQDSATAA